MIDLFSLPDPFRGGLFNRASKERADAAWVSDRLNRSDSKFLILFELHPLIDVTGSDLQIKWLQAEEVLPFRDQETCVLLGINSDGHAVFAMTCDRLAEGQADNFKPLSDYGKFINTRTVSLQVPTGQAALIAQARALLGWHQGHRFCARCGHVTDMVLAGGKRMCCNMDCRAEHFPRTDPVVIMMIVDGDWALLGRSNKLAKGLYTCLAGFVEQGETMEEAVRREIFEESGIYVGSVKYLRSQPWPWPSNLMLGCIGQAISHTICMDQEEMEDVGWYHADQVREGLRACLMSENEIFRLPAPMTIAHHLTREWIEMRDLGKDPFDDDR